MSSFLNKKYNDAEDFIFLQSLKEKYKILFMDNICGLFVLLSWLECISLLFTRYPKTSDIRRTLVDNKIVDHSDVVGALPAGAAPTTSSFST